ncbi:hypothetical protein PFISCL1PPCAC_1235, partial [Pristionchus fissidentatus]
VSLILLVTSCDSRVEPSSLTVNGCTYTTQLVDPDKTTYTISSGSQVHIPFTITRYCPNGPPTNGPAAMPFPWLYSAVRYLGKFLLDFLPHF